jgi:flagellar biogenesis protein FliO
VDTTEPSSHDVENNDKDATSKASFSWRIFVLLIAIAAVIYVAALFIHRQRQQQQRSKNKFNDVSEVEGLLFHNNNNYQNGNNIPSNDRGAPGYGSTAMQ